jgi:hypothetical protein
LIKLIYLGDEIIKGDEEKEDKAACHKLRYIHPHEEGVEPIPMMLSLIKDRDKSDIEHG